MSESLKKNIEDLERKNQLIANHLIDAIWVVDAGTLTFDYITSSIEAISGYPADDYIGNSIQERLTEFSFMELKPMLSPGALKQEGHRPTTRTVEVELKHCSGSTYWAEIRARLVKDSSSTLKIIGVTRNISRQKTAELEQQRLVEHLRSALAEKQQLLREIQTLRGLLPICSGCKRIRDDQGKWWPIDVYVQQHSQADLTHTICVDCKDIFYDLE